MFTKNWDIIQHGLGLSGTNTLKKIDGNDYSLGTNNGSFYNGCLNGAGYSIFFGTGNTTPTREDYSLENEINSLTVIGQQNNGSQGLSWTNIDNYKYTISQTVRNDTEQNIEIKEYGITFPVSSFRFLILREVLDTSIIIAPGETKTFTITIDK